jgi:cobalt-zinc-cadmium efflux system outer membrane protein
MRWLSASLLSAAVACQAVAADGRWGVETPAAASAQPAGTNTCAAPRPASPEPLNLSTLWDLTLAHNPELREADADVEAARGRCIQAARCPNPQLIYENEDLGTPQAAAGTIKVQIAQEIVTCGKRRLSIAVAQRATDVAQLDLLGRKFDLLARLRRDYYAFVSWVETARVSDEVVASLQTGVESVRALVEDVKSRPRTDLLRIQALLEEARTHQSRSRAYMAAAWLQLAADVGTPCLPMPSEVGGYDFVVPLWEYAVVAQRMLAAHTDLRRAAVATKRASVELERARAEVCPNIQLGGGYSQNFPEHERGALITLQAPLPLWDRKQGLIHEAQARYAKAQAAQHTVELRLNRDLAGAYARYDTARQQVQRLSSEVIPRLTESQELVRKGYQAGAAQLSFADVQLAVETLNDARLRLAEARRDLWQAIADLQGFMQLELGEDLEGIAGGCQTPN